MVIQKTGWYDQSYKVSKFRVWETCFTSDYLENCMTLAHINSNRCSLIKQLLFYFIWGKCVRRNNYYFLGQAFMHFGIKLNGLLLFCVFNQTNYITLNYIASDVTNLKWGFTI